MNMMLVLKAHTRMVPLVLIKEKDTNVSVLIDMKERTVKLTSMTASLAHVHQHQLVSILPMISIAVVPST